MRILIISPHFPPSNAADMHRVRMLLPHLAGQGISAEVLCVQAEQVAAPKDPWLEEGLPGDVPVHRVRALGLEWGRIPGLGTLTFRAMAAIRRKGHELLEGGRFDLVYFSTTQFGIHVLGPEWKKRHGVAFTMDYQDPWVSDYYRNNPGVTPPGGKLKYAVTRWLAGRQEPTVLDACSGITSVSPAYPEQILTRYPDKALPSIVLPFPGDNADLERVRHSAIRQQVFDPADGFQHWVYIGRGGKDMALAVSGIFSALATLKERQPALQRLRLHFIGTSYASQGKGIKTIEPLASQYGLEEMVKEHTDRIPYSQTLRCLLDADGLIVPGSDDPGYTASKIYPYLLAGKPLLTVFHEESSVVSLIRKAGGGTVVPFRSDDNADAIGARVLADALNPDGTLRQVPLDHEAFSAHTARHQAGQLAGFLHRCLTREGRDAVTA
ncbi:hypothetical protein [Luteolibacter luteus]|uniref:Glycosyltransferase family 4 protein n=1 Tax=Luteolibacter luteus TaxID=2728835 RepID=A0A858RDA0_9BACT|nr:hypothetical protein [Luteolibacter luteus]QJE94290.1 glycosyltransferase family 4 protein [Luteolibacter luteus]